MLFCDHLRIEKNFSPHQNRQKYMMAIEQGEVGDQGNQRYDLARPKAGFLLDSPESFWSFSL